ARGRVGEGAGGGKALLPPPAPPPARPGGGKPLPYFGFAPIYVPRGRGVGGEGGWAAGTSWRFVTACGEVRSFRRPPRPPMPRSLLSVAPRTVPILLTSFLLLSLAACERTGDGGGPVRPLIDGEPALDVLTETKDLALPPALGGNRFLSGWWPWKTPEGQVVLSPTAPEARLEIVSLGEGRPRTLVIDLLDRSNGIDQPAGGQVRVKAAGRVVGSFPVRDPIEVTLPADLPLGRVPIDL